MAKDTIRIATRKSRLALWQAETIKNQLLQLHPNLTVELLPLQTTGDKWLDQPLNTVGGKGLFVKELEQLLLTHQADIAVHSLKDVPAELPKGLILSVFCKRESPEDVLLSVHYASLRELPKSAKIGTSSLRRQCQLLAMRPDLNIAMLRGNIDTRIRKLESEDFDAIILAFAGIKRLGLTEHVKEILPTSTILPAIGQGALAIECREDDLKTQTRLKPLLDPETACCVRAERAMNQMLGGSCQVPIAGLATLYQHQLTLQGLVGAPDGGTLLKTTASGPSDEPEALGTYVAQSLLDKGAGAIISSLLAF